jgi:hypothetical protein
MAQNEKAFAMVWLYFQMPIEIIKLNCIVFFLRAAEAKRLAVL